MPNGIRCAVLVSATLATVALLALTSAPEAGAAERDRYIVVFEDSVESPAKLARAQVGQRSGKLGFIYRDVLNGYSAELSAQAAEGLRHDPRVKYVVVDGEVSPAAQTTSTGISRTFAASNKALDIDSVDDLRADVDIAVIDTGVDYTHPDLNVVARTDCSNGTEKEAKCVDSSGTDTIGHGTHVAGIAAAIDNGSGVVGSAPGARIWAVKVLGTGTNYTSEIVAGIEWVTTKRKDGNLENDIEVANMSLECPLCSAKPFNEAIAKSVEAGVVNVVAAGNTKWDAKNTAPASSPDVITVSALADFDGQPGGKAGSTECRKSYESEWGAHSDDSLAAFSNFGSLIEVAAPGVCIRSTVPGGSYAETGWWGTSMAAPHVAGAAALLAAQDPPESKADVEAIAKAIKNEGNLGWTDTSGDGVQEPLLDMSDEAVFSLAGQYLLRNTNSEGSPDLAFQYGLSSDIPVSGDWDNDGDATIGVYRPSAREFYLRNSNSAGEPDLEIEYGLIPATPLVGDWDGNGTETIGLYSSSEAAPYTWALNNANDSSGADYYFTWGTKGDIPIVGDWDNDGDTTIGLYRPSNRTFYLRNTNSEGSADLEVEYGLIPATPIIGDWDGDEKGTETIGLYSSSEAAPYVWALNNANDSSGADYYFTWGAKGNKPIVGDWDGDGDTTVGLFRPLGPTVPIIETKSASGLAPASATLRGNVNPSGYETTYQFEYGTTIEYGSKVPASPKSIGSGSAPVEVSEKIEGLKAETTYHFRLVATNAQGTTKGGDQTFSTPAWKILSTPNPKGASDSNLYDVACEPSTSVCTSVGKSTASGVDSPLVERWNGTSWSEQTPAKKSGSTHNRLLGVDCPSETRCIAVGNYQNAEGGPATLGELWNEGKWNVQTTPVPSEATSSELTGVGCNNTGECMAAGSAVVKGVKKAIAEEWNSPTWTSSTIPIPEGATSSQLDGIDCIWSNFCVAVGRYTTGGGSVKSLAMFWNENKWSLQTLTDPEGAVESTLLDVSCTATPNRCTAVGGWKNGAKEQFTLAYRFNGTSTWTMQSTPNPVGSTESALQDVSCATETSCTAAGSWVSGGSTQTLAEKWNGTTWSIQGTMNPSGAAFSSLFGVSCRSTTCMSVGWSTDGSGVDTTLAEIRE